MFMGDWGEGGVMSLLSQDVCSKGNEVSLPHQTAVMVVYNPPPHTHTH